MTDLIERRELAATPDQVWLALTTADGLRGWFWPARLEAAVTTDGVRYRIASEVADMAVSGRYSRVRSPELLVFSWQWDGEDRESTVRVELAKTEAGTELTLTHTGLVDDQLENHAQGWYDCLDRLPQYVQRTAVR